MKTITINCPDDVGIISVVVIGKEKLLPQMWANQQLREIKDGDVINIRKPDEEEYEQEDKEEES